MDNISVLLVPLFVLFIIVYAFIHKVNVYDSFLKGAKEGMLLVFEIAPTVIAMVFAINLFINSSFIDYIFAFINPLLTRLSIPGIILPMAFLRPISGNATLAILSNIMNSYGPDSFPALLASTLQGCTDTTIYVLALYFGSIGVKKTGHALKAGLLADMVGIVMAFLISCYFFR